MQTQGEHSKFYTDSSTSSGLFQQLVIWEAELLCACQNIFSLLPSYSFHGEQIKVRSLSF